MRKCVFIIVSVIIVLIFFGILSMRNNDQILKIESSSFKNGGSIPAKFSCDGLDINPQISISNIPHNAKTLALIMEDIDAPSGTFYHWIKFNIKVIGTSFEIKENSESFGTSGKGTANNLKYYSPCPPSGTHRYYFRAYALDSELNLPQGITAKELISSMQDHILSQGELMGLYKR